MSPGKLMSVWFDEFDREAYRKRLHKMTDLELLQHSKAARDLFESVCWFSLIWTASALR